MLFTGHEAASIEKIPYAGAYYIYIEYFKGVCC